MELREAHLRYLLMIYELGRAKPEVGIADIARALHCSKASVTKMMANLMELGLLVRERYSKVYLTDRGFLLARDLSRCAAAIRERLPALGLTLTAEEADTLARGIALNLPEGCRRELAARKGGGGAST